jgi:hypothetical protein
LLTSQAANDASNTSDTGVKNTNVKVVPVSTGASVSSSRSAPVLLIEKRSENKQEASLPLQALPVDASIATSASHLNLPFALPVSVMQTNQTLNANTAAPVSDVSNQSSNDPISAAATASATASAAASAAASASTTTATQLMNVSLMLEQQYQKLNQLKMEQRQLIDKQQEASVAAATAVAAAAAAGVPIMSAEQHRDWLLQQQAALNSTVKVGQDFQLIQSQLTLPNMQQSQLSDSNVTSSATVNSNAAAKISNSNQPNASLTGSSTLGLNQFDLNEQQLSLQIAQLQSNLFASTSNSTTLNPCLHPAMS